MTHRALAWGLAVAMLAVGGCASSNSGGFGKDKPEEKPDKTYPGLTGQTAAVVVWADWPTRTEYAAIQLDLAKMLQDALLPPPDKDKEKEKSKEKQQKPPAVQFINPASVIKYQREHPEVEGMPITEVAPRLGVGRVISVELKDFDAQSAESIMVLKGVAKVNLRVLEVAGKQATIAFEEKDITVHYPPDAPEGVIAGDKYNVRTIYTGTLKKLAEKLALRFDIERD